MNIHAYIYAHPRTHYPPTHTSTPFGQSVHSPTSLNRHARVRNFPFAHLGQAVQEVFPGKAWYLPRRQFSQAHFRKANLPGWHTWVRVSRWCEWCVSSRLHSSSNQVVCSEEVVMFQVPKIDMWWTNTNKYTLTVNDVSRIQIHNTDWTHNTYWANCRSMGNATTKGNWRVTNDCVVTNEKRLD